ncbi:MAG: recombinase family protein [Armatimonadota bacterium]|nr:recombinase family protein [bacterium]
MIIIHQTKHHNLKGHEEDLKFPDGLPIAVGYVRTSSTDDVGRCSAHSQVQGIVYTCDAKFPEGCHLVLVYDLGTSGYTWTPKGDDNRHRTMSSGLKMVAELLEQGIAKHVFVRDISRISHSPFAIIEFSSILDHAKACVVSTYEGEFVPASLAAAASTECVLAALGLLAQMTLEQS